VTSVVFSPDGRRLISSGVDSTIRVWNVHTHAQLRPRTGHTEAVFDVAFGGDGRTVASAAGDGTVRLWDIPRDGHPGPSERVARRLLPLLTSLDQNVSAAVNGVAFSPGALTLAFIDEFDVELRDLHGRRRLSPLKTRSSYPNAVAFAPNGSTLVASGASGDTVIWNPRDGQQLGHLPGRSDDVQSDTDVAVSADGYTLASDDGNNIRLWHIASHKPLGSPLRPPYFGESDLAFSPDSRTLAVATADLKIRLWDVRTHRQVGKPLSGHRDLITNLAFSPDGHLLASTSQDRTVMLWDLRTHRQLGQSLTGHTATVTHVAFSPDGRTLATSSLDKTVRLWDVSARAPLGSPLRGHTSPVLSVAFSTDGATVLSAGADGTIRRWTGLLWRDPAALQREICRVVGIGLTRSQWTRYTFGARYRRGCG
jgi:WD40 repeat protein